MARSKTTVFREPTTRYQWRGLPSSSPSGGNIQDTLVEQATAAQDLVLSLGHPYRKLGKTRGDIGGNFCVVRREYDDDSRYPFHNRTVTNESNSLASNYLGRYFANDYSVTSASFPAASIATNGTLDALGTTAISRVLPTNPLSGLFVALGELRAEGIPLLPGVNTWKSRTSAARSAGGEYLNHQFGWLPLVSDLRKFARVVTQADELVAKYVSESGKLLHRKYTFPNSFSRTETVETGKYPSPAFTVSYWNSAGTKTTTVTTLTRTWFSGAFTYHLPPQGSIGRKDAIANKLLGSRLTPEVVWDLTPWTWAVDWFTNIGEVLHNVGAFMNDGLVMPYGYIMQERTVQQTITLAGARTKRFDLPVDCRQQFTTTVKQRRKATPFGFGLTFGGFSTRQKLIIGALGLTRGSSGMKYE